MFGDVVPSERIWSSYLNVLLVCSWSCGVSWGNGHSTAANLPNSGIGWEAAWPREDHPGTRR